MNAGPGRGLAGLGVWRGRAASGPVRYPAGAVPVPSPAATASAGTAAAAAVLAATLGLAAACWVIAVQQMSGMDMGVATRPGSFGFFAAVWVVMMAAMMLPGAAPAVLRRARASGVRGVPLFAGSYLAVWALVGVVCRVPAARACGRRRGDDRGRCYEVTPLKQHFRRHCREAVRSGFGFGLCCAGSSIGLMSMPVALGVMSVTWMTVIAILAGAQKLLPPTAAIDVPLALAITGLGILTLIAPQLVPGLTPPM